jgi:hypothetical protein
MRIIQPGLWSLGQKLRWLVIVPPSLAVLLLTALVVSILSRNELEKQANQMARESIDDLAIRVENFFHGADVLSRGIASRQRAIGRTADPGTIAFLKALLEATPEREAQGVYIAFEDKAYRQEDAIQWVDRRHWGKASRLDYDYHDAENERCEWYWGAKAKKEGEFAVSRPYFDKGGANIAMVSVTRPIYDAEGAFVGVAGVDLDMTELIHVIKAIAPGREEAGDAEAYLVSQDERVFAHPDQQLPENQASELGYLPLSKMHEGQALAGNERGILHRVRTSSGDLRRLSWTSSRIPGWKVVQSTPDAIVDAPLHKIGQYSFAIGGLFLALMIGIVSVVVTWVTGPSPSSPPRRPPSRRAIIAPMACPVWPIGATSSASWPGGSAGWSRRSPAASSNFATLRRTSRAASGTTAR